MAKPYAHLRAQMSQDTQQRAEDKATALLARELLGGDTQDGWSLWTYATTDASPYLYRQVDLMRREWDTPLRCDPWTLHPLMNVANLYWRPVDEGLPTVAWREEDQHVS